jgi:hypothetical protein
MNFSVVIPLYNKEAYILRAIRSVLSQTHADLELIVVDDGSSDGSARLVRSVQDRRLRLLQQPNGGGSAARNTGIREAAYPYVAFLDADDSWASNHLRTLAALITDYPDAGLYCTGYHLIEPSGKQKQPKWFNVPSRGYIERYFLSVAKGDLVATSSSVCIPAHVFRDIGGFPVGDVLGEDQDMWARIALEYSIAVDSISTTTYFRDTDNRVCVTAKHEAELPYSSRLQSYLDRNRPCGHTADIHACDIQACDIQAYITAGLLTLVSVNLRSGRQAPARKLLQDPRLRRFEIRQLAWFILAYLPRSVTATALRLGDLARELLAAKRPG